MTLSARYSWNTWLDRPFISWRECANNLRIVSQLVVYSVLYFMWSVSMQIHMQNSLCLSYWDVWKGFSRFFEILTSRFGLKPLDYITESVELGITKKYVSQCYRVAYTILYHDTFTLLVSSIFLMKHKSIILKSHRSLPIDQRTTIIQQLFHFFKLHLKH